MDWDSVTGIIAVLMIFGMPVFIIGIICLFLYRSNADRQKTLRMAIEKSDSLQPEVLETLQRMQKRPRTPMSDVRAGIMLVCIALGVVVLDFVSHGYSIGHLAGIAAIPGFIGIALLLMGIIGLNRKS